MGFSATPPGSQSNPIEGLPSSNFTDSQHTFILSGSPAYQSLPSRPSQSEITFASTLGFVRLAPFITYSQAPGPYPGPAPGAPGQPAVTKETLTAPPSVIAFSKYVLLSGLKEVTTSEIKEALGVIHKKSLHDAINRLIRYGVITRVERGRYAVNIDVALKYANRTPQAIRKRDYVALRRYFTNGSAFGLPQHWAGVILQRQLFEEALTTASQGTTPSCLAQLAYPITRLITPSGLVKAIDLPGLYLIPSKSLLHRSKVYCSGGPYAKPLCSAYRAQLDRFLTPLCPICPPLSLYPAPAGPSRVVGPLADYERRLVPLSALPRSARKYELGYQLYCSALYAFHRYFDAKVEGRGGLIYITVKPRRGVTKRCLASALTALPFIVHRYLSLLLSALDAIADYGRSYTGLTTPELMARSGSVLEEALYRKRRPRPAPGLPHLYIKEIRYRVKRYDPGKRDFGWVHVRVGEAKDFSQLMALVGEREDFSVEVPYRLTYLELTLVIPDPTGQAIRYLGAGYLYIYHNPAKDPEGAVRVEFRPYKHVTSYVAPEGLNVMFYGLAMALTVPVDLAMRAGATGWLA